MNDRSALFCGSRLHDSFRAREMSLRDQVDGFSPVQILSLPEEQLVEHFVATSQVEPLQIFEDEKELDTRETKVDVSGDQSRFFHAGQGAFYVPGYELRVTIPFTGESQLWSLMPNTHQLTFPSGRIEPPTNGRRGTLVITIVQPADLPTEQIKGKVDGTLQLVRFYLNHQKPQVDAFNAALPNHFRQHIRARKGRLETQGGFNKMLGIPVKRREGAPSMEPIRLTRQLVRPLPSVSQGAYKPEPGIEDNIYEHILSVIRHEGRTFETLSKTFERFDEEELRDILLAHLNGHYEGLATGETFRRTGKTDIRIEERDRAAFVAECKMWRGPAELPVAVDQLLSYLTWRDAKTALVIFNRQNSKFSELLEKIPEVLKVHKAFRRFGIQGQKGEWRLSMGAPGDDGREIAVHVFAFNLHVPGSSAREAS